jgi:hypothetical protein
MFAQTVLRRGVLTDVLDEFGPSGRRNGIVKGEVVLLVEGCATDSASLLISAAAEAASSTAAAPAAVQQEQQNADPASSRPAGERMLCWCRAHKFLVFCFNRSVRAILCP